MVPELGRGIVDVEAKYSELLQAANWAQRQPLAHTAEGQRIQANLDRLAGLVSTLDDYLSQGGRPPAAWSEGPDEPYMDTDHLCDEECGDEPTPRAAADADDAVRLMRDDDYTPEAVDRDDALSVLFDRGQPFERPNVIDPRDLQPLGSTTPGVAGSVLPEDAS